MARSVSARAVLPAAVLLLTVAACGSTSTGSAVASPPPTTVTAPASIAATPATAVPASATPSAATVPATYDTTSLGSTFDLPMTIDLPAPWKALPPPDFGPAGAFTFVHTGTPADDASQWWGPDLDLVDGASVADPAGIDQPAAAGDPQLPWPKSYIDYLTSIPGVTVVDGPDPVTIGGVEGRQVTLTVPAMHPTIFLKGDTMWIGGGPSGLNPPGQVEVTELMVHGTPLIITYGDAPQTFDEHRAMVDTVLKSIAFPTDGS